MPEPEEKAIVIRYHVRAPGREPITLKLLLDRRTLQLIAAPLEPAPSWTALAHEQCPNCPLKPSESPQCPAATSIAPIVEWFQRTVSHETLSAVCDMSGIHSK